MRQFPERYARPMRLTAIVIVAALCGCKTEPAVPTSERRVSDPQRSISVPSFLAKPPEGSEAKRWTPGSKIKVEAQIKNLGEPLKDYPSLVLESDDDRITVIAGEKVLYGIGDGIEQSWIVETKPEVPVGTTATLTLRVFGHNFDYRDKRPPLCEATLKVEVGQELGQ